MNKITDYSMTKVMKKYLLDHRKDHDLKIEWIQEMNLEELEYYYKMDLNKYLNEGPEL